MTRGCPVVSTLCQALSALFRYSLNMDEPLATVSEELRHLKNYLFVMNVRTQNGLHLTLDIPQEALEARVPRLSLQPLVENAIFHGLEPKGGHGSVLLDISTDPDTGDVLLHITDDGVGMPPEQVAHLLDEPAEGAEKAEKFRHVGLWNVNRRIRYSFGEGYGLTIESEEDVGTEVTIRLPYQQKGDTHAADITGG